MDSITFSIWWHDGCNGEGEVVISIVMRSEMLVVDELGNKEVILQMFDVVLPWKVNQYNIYPS